MTMTRIPRNPPAPRLARGLAAAWLACAGTALLGGCVATMPTLGGASSSAAPAAPAGVQVVPPGAIPMPPGADYHRATLLNEGKVTKVYVDVLRFGDDGARKDLFPPSMQSRVEFSRAGVTRLFTDTILQSRRFEVYDMRSSVTADKTEYVVDAQVIQATQVLRPLEGGLRVAETRVTVSVQMKNVYENSFVFPAAVLVDGITGQTSGGRTVLTQADNPSDPRIVNSLAADYQNALRLAFAKATERIESILRPLGRVTAIDGQDVGVFGGFRNGYQQGDEMVVFRAQTTTLGGREVFSLTRPVALVSCNGVGTETSQCVIRQKVAGTEPQAGDYTVITDESLRRPRAQ